MKSKSCLLNRLSLDLRYGSLQVYIVGLMIALLTACTSRTPPSPTATPIPLAKELIYYGWPEDIPQPILDRFTTEYGVKVISLAYDSQEEAIGNIQTGQVYDIVLLESRFIPMIIKGGMAAELDSANVQNIKNISANFRELAYDPNNKYSIPGAWGTTGLVVRSDLVADPVTRWGDLWDPRYQGKVGIWVDEPREVISLTLKSLGYSANSEEPAELEKALYRLLELKPRLVKFDDSNFATPDGVIATGKVIVSMGYAGDALDASDYNPAVTYVLPQDGALIWNDAFIIPANSPHQYTAELFLNFLMRADVSAQISNLYGYATPNEASYPLINSEILNNPLLFPKNEDLANAELIMPLTPEGQQLYDKIWEQFITAP
jgi:spermidine/putrescine transport system substrate-binding protein